MGKSTQDKIIWVLGVIIAGLLIITISMSYAYFTAKVESVDSGEISFGYLTLDLTDNLTPSIAGKTDFTNIVPGCTITLDGKLTLKSNISCFVRVTVECFIGDEEGNRFNELFGDDVLTDIAASAQLKAYEGYYYGRYNMPKGGNEEETILKFEDLPLTVNRDTVGNEYQGKQIVFSIKAEAIQAEHLSEDDSLPQDLINAETSLLKKIAGLDAWKSCSNGGLPGSATLPNSKGPDTGEDTGTSPENTNTGSYGTGNNNESGEKDKIVEVLNDEFQPEYFGDTGEGTDEGTIETQYLYSTGDVTVSPFHCNGNCSPSCKICSLISREGSYNLTIEFNARSIIVDGNGAISGNGECDETNPGDIKNYVMLYIMSNTLMNSESETELVYCVEGGENIKCVLNNVCISIPEGCAIKFILKYEKD